MATLLDIVKKGSTNRSVTVRIIDSTAGTPETGVVFNTSGIDLWYRRESAALVSISEVTLAALTTAHADGGFLHISDGEYRLDLPDAAFATGAQHVEVGGTVTGMVVIGGRVRLVDYDPEDTVRMGLTALPSAAADAAGGLPISDAGGLDLDAMNAAAVRLTAARAAILTDWVNGGRLDLLLDAIPTTAMRGTDSAALASVVGALNDAAAAGEVTTADTLVQYIKQLINVLTGAPGIGAFPAEAAPANGVSLAEVIRAIHTDTNKLVFTSAGRVDANMEAINDKTASAVALGEHAPTAIPFLIDAGATTTTIIFDATAGVDGGTPSAVNDFYNGRVITFLTGALKNQSTDITDYVGATRTATITAVTSSPSDGDTGEIT